MPDRKKLRALRCFLLKRGTKAPDEVFEHPGELTPYRVKRGSGVRGTLYVRSRKRQDLPWVAFLRDGIQGGIPRLGSTAHSAVLLADVKKRTFAFCFGYGWTMLKSGAVEQDFGVRTALNCVPSNAVRAVDTHTFEEFSLFTRSQASRACSLESFGLDIDRDILRAVAGSPDDRQLAEVMAGNEGSLAFTARLDFEDLAEKAEALLRAYGRRRYREQYDWVDNIRRVRDGMLIEALDQALVARLDVTPLERIHASPPEPLEWDDVAGYSIQPLAREHESEIPLSTYIEKRKARSGLSIDDLKTAIVHVNRASDDAPYGRWQLYRCLVGEVTRPDGVFILTNGMWFRIDKEFVGRVRGRMATIQERDIGLPSATVGEIERDYNARAAAVVGWPLLDRDLIRCYGARNEIEACDIFNPNGQFVHVKPKHGGSKSFSHLFAQGANAGEAFVEDANFRTALRDKLLGKDPTAASRIPLERPKADAFEVVFAIIGNYAGPVVDGLPFFSQLTLMRVVQALGVRGMGVSVAKVSIV